MTPQVGGGWHHIYCSSNNPKIYDPHLRVPGALEFADLKQQNPTSRFEKQGPDVHSIAASV